MKGLLIIFLFLAFLQSLSSLPKSAASTTTTPTPMNCSDTGRICTSFLAFKPTSSNESHLSLIQSMFDILPEEVTVENSDLDYIFIRKNCSCDSKWRSYLTNTTYTVRESDGYAYDLVGKAYNGLAYLPNWKNNTRKARLGAVIAVRLFCGCSSGLWNYLMSYVMRDGDTVASLASRFGVSMDSIEQVNGIQNPDNFTVGSLYYIPLNSVPGEPYPVETSISPVAVPSPSADNTTETELNHKSRVPYGWILGSSGAALGFILVILLVCITLKSSVCCSKRRGSDGKDVDGRNTHKFQILQSASFCCASGRDICCSSSEWKQTNGETNDHQINIPKVIGSDVFEVEKPVVYMYEEVLSATDGFSETNLLGHGTYGSVYYGLLHDQEVAIKRMTATKSKEFMAEMKVLCRVHHANLVELIGYAATNDELFLVYEYAQKGSLRNHLHDLHNKGHTSLSWIMRVQIALDAARGLEYIHEHTKAHYIHRDIKTSNILLDSAFRAKISDFGLAKLVGKPGDGDVSATRVVGTYGYLAPEYLGEGLATAKSDVYAFGVVMFEIISGKEAVIRTEGMTKNLERRSLVSIMLAALRNVPDSMSMSNMKDHIDPNLMNLYPHDCVFKMAMLAKQCVDDDPILRPDMKQVVISLSQVLLSSVEWEATLAGNSQIFSDLVQGR
ncbi:LysM domain receptor-like kinase 3 [Ancistrocladus abbreviatus]